MKPCGKRPPPIAGTLHVSRSEYPRDKPFLLTMVSYSKNNYNREKINKIPQALSELPANGPGQFSQKGWLGLAS